MARVTFTANLRRHRDTPVAQASGKTVRAVLDLVFAEDPMLRSYILDDQGRLRRHVNIFLNNQKITDRQALTDPVRESDEIYVLQALSGG